jgi:hypothetical protein
MTAAFHSEAMRRLDTRSRSQASRLTAEPDPVKPGGWIVRDAETPYRIQLVNADGECSCVAYGVWGQCRHVALVAKGDAQ